MNLRQAKTIALEVADRLAPFCDRIHIAGSIRRQKSEVKDIEIVCQPTMDKVEDLFGGTLKTYRNTSFIFEVYELGIIGKGKPEDGKYCQIGLNTKVGEIKLDLFMPEPNDYFRQLAIRTGSAEYSHKEIATGWNKIGWCGTKEGLRKKDECTGKTKDNKTTYTCHRTNPTLPPVWTSEEDFFNWIKVRYVLPQYRNY